MQLDKQEEILRIMSDQCARKIINIIQKEPKSAIQISKELDAELSTVYRRLNKFQKHNLLDVTFHITPDGKKSFYYQCKINSINASYKHGKFEVNLAFN